MKQDNSKVRIKREREYVYLSGQKRYADHGVNQSGI